MHTLPAVVPEGEFPRSDIVAVRLARKVAPLFGVRWAHNPFGCTWVCDFGALTLAEIARGAPLPSKEARLSTPGPASTDTTSSATGTEAEPSIPGPARNWSWSGRAVSTPERSQPPGALANATLNRFGPDTKAAVVLTGTNRLLVDATDAVAAVCRHLNTTPVDQPVRLAIWAGLVLEVFRAQPALVVAAIQARAVQQSLTARWGTQVVLGDLSLNSARCELGAGSIPSHNDPWHPNRFNLIDDTLAILEFPSTPGRADLSQDRRQSIATAWCRRLLQMGRPGSGMVWLVEGQQGHRAAHSYQRVGAMVAPFVAEVLDSETLRARPKPNSQPLLLKPAEEILSQPPMVVRAHAVATHVAVNYLRYVKESAPDFHLLREQTRELVERSAETTTAILGPTDPASLLLTGYREYLNVWDQARSGGPDATALLHAVNLLTTGGQRTAEAHRAGHLDPGTASYLLEIANVALSKVREHLPPSSLALDRILARSWRETLTARGLPPEPAARLDELSRSQIFHLSNYAEYLASRSPTSDLRKALRIFEAVIEVRESVAANEPVPLTAKHAAARDTHQAAAHIAAQVAQSLPARERTARASAWEAAIRHSLAVLADPSIEELNTRGGSDMTAVWAVIQLEPALTHLLDEKPEALPAQSRETALRLLDRARNHLRLTLRSDREADLDARLEGLHRRLTSS